ncbi:helix-turn-helix transcriptional regulator [Salinicola rhizosphaerae]|uniref:AraC family transcriptional regulator n=1 Tax=Salinicola rhizosphaerae TaxID=1443141 RepID=A0ABQ3E2X0_9GAMM|nr:AraC family transcriptional regulator [Salinicola rhizosphaerae]GHB24573.1 AraC family transcriptional regulator [Salinicola rhizosphaerae]
MSPDNVANAAARRQALRVDDFVHFERRYALRHHFPDLEPANRTSRTANPLAIEGCIRERQPMPGCQWVGSDLDIHQTCETHALANGPAHLSIIVVLEGEAELRLADEYWRVGAGQSALIAYDGRQPLSARHRSQQRIRAINLTVTAETLASDTRLSPLHRLLSQGSQCRSLALGSGLMRSLDAWVATEEPGRDESLLEEGLTLQVLSRALSHAPATEPLPALTPRDREWIERVRHYLQAHPDADHTLTDLAKLACMSPSALRSKYRRHYGRSVFDHLREYRLLLAMRLLREGLKVQDVAFRVGYRHATNFATAFRQLHGIAPSDVYQVPEFHRARHLRHPP